MAGEDIPLPMRVVHVSHDMEAIARLASPGDALATVVDRRGRTYDPVLADLFAVHGARWLESLAKLDPAGASALRRPAAPNRDVQSVRSARARVTAAVRLETLSRR